MNWNAIGGTLLIVVAIFSFFGVVIWTTDIITDLEDRRVIKMTKVCKEFGLIYKENTCQ